MNKRVLIVEDDKELALELCYLLFGFHIDAYRAANGWQAIDALEDVKPDLIIVDINMPEMDGRALCKKLETMGILKRVPIIILTGYPNRINEFKTFGVQEFLVKPFEGERLLAAIERILLSR